MGWGGQYSIMGRGVSNCIPDYFPDFDGTGLVKEEHVGGGVVDRGEAVIGFGGMERLRRFGGW